MSCSLFLFFLLLSVVPVRAQAVHTYQTSPDLTQRLARKRTIHFSRHAGSGRGPTITVDDSQRFQTMDGFGASITDAAGWLLEEKLAAVQREQVMTDLFDPRHGIGLSFLRQPIGSTDLSRYHFSFDDIPAGQADPTLEHFSVAPNEKDIFPAIREALKLNPAISVLLTPWSPPAWMKTKGSMDGGRLREEFMAAYAAYLTRSVQGFEAARIPVKFLSVQNEPLNETRDYPGTVLPAEQAAQLIGQDLGPDLRKAGLKTMVLAYDHNWDHPEYPETILADKAAAQYVAGSALHCYGGDVTAQNEIHAMFPDKGIWMTECSGGTWDKEPALVKTARLLIESTRNWAKSVVLWGVALDAQHGPHDGGCGTCRPLVEIDTKQSPARISYTGDFYGLAHASRFVTPGAVRVASTSFGRDALETVAFQNIDGTLALLVLNNSSSSSPCHVAWHDRTFTAEVPGGSLTTFVWKP